MCEYMYVLKITESRIFMIFPGNIELKIQRTKVIMGVSKRFDNELHI